ncbi:TPM domain-containing protein [Bisgaard Taxon 10/6]|uniref:TPM domain-containing protein n=1 Tax=Exercitatus varius TaxID=67857 RepID=A0ABT6EQB5_9PAST|nr:TPM domain-containing protein [Exercitatus varius]MDG2914686.1 TPM domain-containing protein [Exercitatus varius]MDG2917157.1 TPM domain-containing protein [Exercitatus varius]MDG2939253.1 TPM domain-containing protein [Exercitatus varius]MDG2942667.1 TPM domain-containing protein [Exercitatus varius]MDG2945181.1 TPM domain-containing protein [Exercitatus varius]
MSLFSRIPFDKQLIERAIAKLEQQTSAELRVYIERYLKNMPVLDRTLQVFDELEMGKTQARNAVLIYIAHKDRQCAVIGDIGIHQFVGNEFWQQTTDAMIARFKQDNYTDGVVEAIQKIAKELAAHYPNRPDDVNELPNEVIIHE